jgi:LysR family glycine cleavage system transcriptional activator
MASRLPPLGALQAFVAVARHLSFSKAAGELHVTPAAITHQVHNLERNLGTRLLQRNTRYVTLTRTGEACLPELVQALEMLRSAVSNARAVTDRTVLNVSVAPAFASKLLLPRLPEFSELHPDIDIRVSATTQLVDLTDGDTDLAIRFGPGKYKGTYVERLLAESVIPMCAPSLLSKGNGIQAPADLQHHKLIHDLSIVAPEVQPDWRTWLVRAGAAGVDPTRGLRFSLADLALQAAINGFGVVLGRKTLARHDLKSKRLVLPFELELPVSFSYFVVIPTSRFKDQTVGKFRDWLMSTASEVDGPGGARPVQTRLPERKSRRP